MLLILAGQGAARLLTRLLCSTEQAAQSSAGMAHKKAVAYIARFCLMHMQSDLQDSQTVSILQLWISEVASNSLHAKALPLPSDLYVSADGIGCISLLRMAGPNHPSPKVTTSATPALLLAPGFPSSSNSSCS